jgi:hypothetical protein
VTWVKIPFVTIVEEGEPENGEMDTVMGLTHPVVTVCVGTGPHDSPPFLAGYNIF